jgi:hypothetical protein
MHVLIASAAGVTGANGKELAAVNGDYDGMSPDWETIALPYAGTMKFQISFPGLGYGPTDKVIVTEVVTSE